MTDASRNPTTISHTEAIRSRCIQAAVDGYETASVRGVCHEGAWEIALGAMRAADLQEPSSDDLQAQVRQLSATFAQDGAPAAGSAAAATGAAAAGLLQWLATLSFRRPGPFSECAAQIRRQAGQLQQDLSLAARVDAQLVAAWIDARRRQTQGPAVDVTTSSVLDIARSCAQVAMLAAQILRDGPASVRADAAVARDLALAAGDAALLLATENLRHADADADEDLRPLRDGLRSVEAGLQRTRSEAQYICA